MRPIVKRIDPPQEVRPVLCLDIDGTVRKSKSGKTFIEGPEDIVLIDGIEEAIWQYKNKGYLVYGVSNQGGVAHGFKTLEAVKEEFGETVNLFEKNPFECIIFCQHDEKGTVVPYNRRSLLRKPSIGMLVWVEIKTYQNLNIYVDWDNSLFVGDRPEDEQCAANANVPFMWISDFLKQKP